MKSFYLMLALAILQSSTLFANVGFRSCENVSSDNGLTTAKTRRQVNNPTDYSINPGYDAKTSFIPDDIELYYDSENCDNTKIVGYHAHNGDSAKEQSAITEVNIFYNINGFSTLYFVNDRISSQSNDAHWVLYGHIYKLNFNQNYFTINESAVNGDPFNGDQIHETSNITSQLSFGSVDKPCFFKRDDSEFSFSSHESNDGCKITITSTGESGTTHAFSSTVDIECESGEVENCYKLFDLRNSQNEVLDIRLKTNGLVFTFVDAEGNEI